MCAFYALNFRTYDYNLPVKFIVFALRVLFACEIGMDW